jgi:hypothetical protein
MFEWLPISKAADFDRLVDLVDPTEYGLQDVVDWLRAHINDKVAGVLVEYPYIDKDYRSTFYHYYAKKGRTYSSQSARLHFFPKGWELRPNPLTLGQPAEGTTPEDATVSKDYLGFMILRPTRINTIGRTVLDPSVMRDVGGWIIGHRHKAHVLGHRVDTRGFPFMQQHTDIAVCAHTACWAILRHYSERYSLYREVLVHDVSRLGREFDPGGLLPSLGITAREVERIFAAVGTFPLLVMRGKDDAAAETRYYDELLAYLDSGFPLFGVQSARGHAVAVVGYRLAGKAQGDPAAYRASEWDFVSHLLVVDDNYYPYMPVARAADAAAPYTVDDIDGFIVPLPEKMFLPAVAAHAWASDFKSDPLPEFDELAALPDLVVRCFVTTTASWQRFVRKHALTLNGEFVTAALELTMPQFLWVIEYATLAQRAKDEIQARVLLDATAGPYDPFPAFLVHDRKGALWIDRANNTSMQYQPFDKPTATLVKMANNLQEF